MFDDGQPTSTSLLVNLVPKRLTLGSGHPLELFVELELPLVYVVQEFINLGVHHKP